MKKKGFKLKVEPAKPRLKSIHRGGKHSIKKKYNGNTKQNKNWKKDES